MKEKAEQIPVYCPKCKAEWQPNATCCSGCGAKLAPRELPPTPQRSGAKAEREIEYTEETIRVNDHATVIVRRPILTAEERKKREQQVVDTLSAIARSGKGFLKNDSQKE